VLIPRSYEQISTFPLAWVPCLVSDSIQTDKQLVEAVRRGDRAAAGRLAEKYLRGCRAVALAIIGEIPGAEDVSQNAFIYALERIDDCRDPARFGAWLRQIVRSQAKNYLRHARVRRTEQLLDDTAVTEAESPVDAAERSDLRMRLLKALSTLPEAQREVVLLHDLEGWTHDEISERMRIPSGTVRSHLHFARRQLRELLGDFTRNDHGH
jgi:RNA polymerase sigma-70 factor (ECF subfamily)